MSMLSAKVDELRAMAESVGLAMPQAATLMMEASDTILSLRDRAHRERSEADRLREELEAVGTAAYIYGRGDLKTENAKLRELVSNCHGWLAVNCEKGYVIPRNGLDAIEQSMRELGVEVD